MFDGLIRFWHWFVPIYMQFHLIVFRVLIPAALLLWGGAVFLNWLGQQFKPCPSCKKVIPRKRQKCQYCGHVFAGETAPAASDREPRSR